MKRFCLLLVAGLLGLGAEAQTITLDYPLALGVDVTQLPAPVMTLGPNGRWSSTIRYDVRDSVGYDAVGVVKQIERLIGRIDIEISAMEINALLHLPATNKYAPGEWDAKALQAGFVKAMILLQSVEQKRQYEKYWNQLVYDPVPVAQPTADGDGTPIVGWTDAGEPIVDYGENGEPVIGTPLIDKDGVAVVGIWDGLPVIGYDELGYPQTSAFE